MSALAYPEARGSTLVMDYLNIHAKESLTDAFGSKMGPQVWRRFTVHHTPKPGDRLNQAEIEIGIFAKQCLGKRRIPDLQPLRQECKARAKPINKAGTKIDWTFDLKTAGKTFGYKTTSLARSEH